VAALRSLIFASALLLAGCGAAGGWTRPGADAAAVDADYRDCRGLAEEATRTDRDIDQDIMATRQNDWQRAQLGRVASETMREQTRDRAAAIIGSCMRSKGFAPPR